MADESKISVTQNEALNGVSFSMLPETTIATSRSFKRQFFQKSTYKAGEQAICDWNSGDAYINPRRSYLAITLSASTQANFGVGGVTNLIKRIVITSRSGTELSRTEDYNLLAVKQIRHGCSESYVTNFGSVMGYTNSDTEVEKTYSQIPLDGAAPPAPTKKTYLIPLTLLSGFWANDGVSLLPPQLSAGLRVELTLESDAKAMQSNAASVYTIHDISFMLNSTSMVDSWQKTISERSAKTGLTYSYSEWHTTQSTLPSGESSLNMEVRKAVARSLMSFVQGSSEGVSFGVDNMKSEDWDSTSVQWRLGSLYPTQQPVTNVAEEYFQSQSMWDGGVLDCKRPNGINLKNFQESTVDKVDGFGLYAVSLERNDVSFNSTLNIGGLPTNNSRSLAVEITTVPPTVPTARVFHLFMKHLRICKIFLDNVSVSE